VPTKQKQAAAPVEPPTINPDAHYTYAGVAELLNMTEEGVKRLVYSGRLGHVEVNAKNWRIKGSQLIAYLERQTRGAVR
jgi:excisionase family DNA binding protein